MSFSASVESGGRSSCGANLSSAKQIHNCEINLRKSSLDKAGEISSVSKILAKSVVYIRRKTEKQFDLSALIRHAILPSAFEARVETESVLDQRSPAHMGYRIGCRGLPEP